MDLEKEVLALKKANENLTKIVNNQGKQLAQFDEIKKTLNQLENGIQKDLKFALKELIRLHEKFDSSEQIGNLAEGKFEDITGDSITDERFE